MPAPDPVTTARRPYLALRHRDFRLLGVAQLLSMTGTQMQVMALNWHVYLLTRSPLALGLVGLTRVVPIVLFSLWGGIVADRRDRRRVMLVTQSGMTICALALFSLTFTRHETVFLIYLLNALTAAAVAFDAPARQALTPRLVPAQDLPGALALNLSFQQAATIFGPALAGLIIAGSGGMLTAGLTRLASAESGGVARAGGLSWIYLLNAVSFGAVLLALLFLRTSGKVAPRTGAHEPPLRALRQGLHFVFTTPLMVWTMALDFFATFFAGAMSLLPIFADQVLHVGARGYGLLAAAPALGALLGSLYTSIRSLPARQGPVLLGSIAGYGLATVVFGLSRSYPLTLLALAMTGLMDLVSTVIRQTLRQLITTDDLRGRMTSVNMIFFMGGPQLGELEAGLVASVFASAALGATVSVVSGGIATLFVVAAVAVLSPLVRRYDVREH